MTLIARCHECQKRYRVPDDRAGKRVKCKQCGTIFDVPPPDDDAPTSEDGTAIYRHEYRDRDFELAVGDEQNIEAVSNHIERYLGKVESVFHELVSDLVHIDIHWVKPNKKRPWHTLVTSGMSDRPMIVPDPCREFEFAELCIHLPPTWKISESAFESEDNYWPLRLLKVLARLPHEFETWLGVGHTVPNGDPAEPYASNTQFSCALVLPPMASPDDFHRMDTDDGRTTWFYSVVPLYSTETDFKLKHGLEKLLSRFDKHGIVDDIVRLDRVNTCRKKWLGLF